MTISDGFDALEIHDTYQQGDLSSLSYTGKIQTHSSIVVEVRTESFKASNKRDPIRAQARRTTSASTSTSTSARGAALEVGGAWAEICRRSPAGAR